MKKSTRKIPTIRIKELARELDTELNKHLQLTVLSNGVIVYKNYMIKETKLGNWGVYDYKQSKDPVEQYYTKTCAIMAAKAYEAVQLEKFHEIKRLDNLYWANHTDAIIYKHNMKLASDLNRYLVLLNRLEESKLREEHYQAEISKMFKWSFV